MEAKRIRNVPIYYYFQKGKNQNSDDSLNVYAIQNKYSSLNKVSYCSNLFALQIKVSEVLSQFPYQENLQNYHFRFKTTSFESEPPMQIQLFIQYMQNLNSRVPIVNNAVYMKILVGPEGLKLTKQCEKTNDQTKQQYEEKQMQKEHKISDDQFTDFQESKSPVIQNLGIQDYNFNQSEDDWKNINNNNNNQSGENTKKSEENITPANKDLFEFEDNDVDDDDQQNSASEKNQSDDWSAKVEIGISPQFVQWDDVPQPYHKSLFVKSNAQLMGFQDSTNLSENDKKEAERKGEQAGQNYRDKIRQDEESNEMRLQIASQMDPIIKKWAFKNEVKTNLRGLIASLHTIAWEESGWLPVDFMDLIEDNNLKKLYKKALIKFHPDKHRQPGKEKNKYLAERITTYLTYAMKEFTPEESK